MREAIKHLLVQTLRCKLVNCGNIIGGNNPFLKMFFLFTKKMTSKCDNSFGDTYSL